MEPRPSHNGGAMAKLLATRMLPKVIKWMGPKAGPPGPIECEDGVAPHQDLLEALEDAVKFDDDGYEIASSLEGDAYITPDSELVEILDETGFIRYDIHRTLVSEWVKANNLTPRFKVGDEVRMLDHTATWAHAKFKGLVGEVTEVRAEQMTYTVMYESLGDVRMGTPMPQGKGCQTFGTILPDENLELATDCKG